MQFVRSFATSRRALASYACAKPSNLYIVRHGARLDQLEPKWREEAKSLGEYMQDFIIRGTRCWAILFSLVE
jgi:hypothetical protein